jgi:hypothetical protein
MVVSQGTRDFFFALAVVFIGPPVIGGIAVGIWGLVEGHPEEGVGALFFAAMLAAFLAGFRYSWLTWRKFGKSVCHLETLPGVIGGWFKASVEVKLPVETRPAVLVRLENRKGWSTTVWEITERVFPAQFTHIQGDRYLVPVRFHIPARKDYYANTPWNRLVGMSWCLYITAELPGADLNALFQVPIFETDEAPPEEQTPEGELWTVEVVYGWGWFRFKYLDAELIAKAGRENTFSGWGRKRKRDLGWCFKTEAEAQECANKFRGDPTLRVRVYDEEHQRTGRQALIS